MSAATDCNCLCPSPVVSEVPGTAGSSSFSTVIDSFVIGANNTQHAVPLVDSSWLIPGEIVIFQGVVHAEVFSLGPIPVFIWRFQSGDLGPGDTIAAGALVGPSGRQGAAIDDPLLIANGGTSATTSAAAITALFTGNTLAIGFGGTGSSTKATAQTALGLGQDSVVSTVTGLAQAITASATQIAGSDITVPAAGSYLVTGSVSIDYIGVTFAASRVITITVRNTTQGVDIITVTRNTGILTTAGLPTQDIKFSETVYAGGVANDHIQVRISVSVINSAGTFAVLASTCCITPLRKS